MTDKRYFALIGEDGYVYPVFFDSENGDKEIDVDIVVDLLNENEQLKQFKDTTFVLINEMIETANIYRTPIKSLSYGDDLGYWNGVYQKLKELKEILEKDGEQNGN